MTEVILIQRWAMPEIKQYQGLGSLVWPQDVAPPHFRRNVRRFLDEKFPMWTGHRGSVFCPQRLLNFHPVNFSMRDIDTDKAYCSKKPVYVLQMKEETRVELNK